MRMLRWMLPVLCPVLLFSADIAPPIVAKILKIIVSSPDSPSQVAVADSEIAAELGKVGVSIDPEARVLWAITEAEVVKAAKQGRLVVCPNVALLQRGASIALTVEGGRAAIYIHQAHLAASKVAVPDAVVKVAKVLK